MPPHHTGGQACELENARAQAGILSNIFENRGPPTQDGSGIRYRAVAQNMINIQAVEGFRWCCQRDSNTRPHPYQGCALPLELWQHCHRRA